MIQCKDCEFCEMDESGQVSFACNPFTNVKEPECLTKHQLLRLEMMTRAYMQTVSAYKKIAPMQQKLYRHMSRELDEMDEADNWKRADEEDEPDDDVFDDDLPPLDDRL